MSEKGVTAGQERVAGSEITGQFVNGRKKKKHCRQQNKDKMQHLCNISYALSNFKYMQNT